MPRMRWEQPACPASQLFRPPAHVTGDEELDEETAGRCHTLVRSHQLVLSAQERSHQPSQRLPETPFAVSTRPSPAAHQAGAFVPVPSAPHWPLLRTTSPSGSCVRAERKSSSTPSHASRVIPASSPASGSVASSATAHPVPLPTCASFAPVAVTRTWTRTYLGSSGGVQRRIDSTHDTTRHDTTLSIRVIRTSCYASPDHPRDNAPREEGLRLCASSLRPSKRLPLRRLPFPPPSLRMLCSLCSPSLLCCSAPFTGCFGVACALLRTEMRRGGVAEHNLLPRARTPSRQSLCDACPGHGAEERAKKGSDGGAGGLGPTMHYRWEKSFAEDGVRSERRGILASRLILRHPSVVYPAAAATYAREFGIATRVRIRIPARRAELDEHAALDLPDAAPQADEDLAALTFSLYLDTSMPPSRRVHIHPDSVTQDSLFSLRRASRSHPRSFRSFRFASPVPRVILRLVTACARKHSPAGRRMMDGGDGWAAADDDRGGRGMGGAGADEDGRVRKDGRRQANRVGMDSGQRRAALGVPPSVVQEGSPFRVALALAGVRIGTAVSGQRSARMARIGKLALILSPNFKLQHFRHVSRAVPGQKDQNHQYFWHAMKVAAEGAVYIHGGGGGLGEGPRVKILRKLHFAKMEGSDVTRTVALYHGDDAETEWRRDIATYSAVRRVSCCPLESPKHCATS
ncbi:hypothetical protein C8R45DRAFT_946960 [Mycena sanguinolenta]|nr:hypothetical protein C8R45DRAFT_946960 [Mycena sanguinolenta]